MQKNGAGREYRKTVTTKYGLDEQLRIVEVSITSCRGIVQSYGYIDGDFVDTTTRLDWIARHSIIQLIHI